MLIVSAKDRIGTRNEERKRFIDSPANRVIVLAQVCVRKRFRDLNCGLASENLGLIQNILRPSLFVMKASGPQNILVKKAFNLTVYKFELCV